MTTKTVTAFAPGRVNFIGEHTDYNGGLVMPAALDMGVTVTAMALWEPILKIHSLDFDKEGSFDLDTLKRDDTQSWANCPKGMVAVLREKFHFEGGVALTITGTIPMGSGLSSSAACEVAVGKALCELFNLSLTPIELALAAQQAEHRFTGTLCGIMDQAISALGKKDHLVRLDCATLQWNYIPFNLGSAKLLITHSGVKHNLADGEYNKRRADCALALKKVQSLDPAIPSLCATPVPLLEKNRALFSETEYKRAIHAATEQLRVMAASKTLAENQFEETGRLMTASHRSLSRDYEVSCEELDWLVDNALKLPGVYGARMTGGGFGGCMIVLLEGSSEAAYRASLDSYETKFSVKPMVFEAKPSDGARIL